MSLVVSQLSLSLLSETAETLIHMIYLLLQKMCCFRWTVLQLSPSYLTSPFTIRSFSFLQRLFYQ